MLLAKFLKCFFIDKISIIFSSSSSSISRIKKRRVRNPTKIKSYFAKNLTRFRISASVEKQIAANLHYLAGEGRMREGANSFGIGKSIISKIVRRFTLAISKTLGKKCIVLPTQKDKISDMAAKFHEAHGFLQCNVTHTIEPM